MKRFLFKIEIQGYGSTVEQAWNDAVTEFSLEPGPPSLEYEEKGEDE